MINSFRAEMRKIWTVRSTYVIGLLVLAITVGLMGFWIFGFKDSEHAARNSYALLTLLYQAVSTAGIFLAFIALLSMGHEYRYNMILYSLTGVRRRTTLFFSKWLATIWSALLVAAVAMVLCVVAFYIGQQVHQVHTMTQVLPGWDFVGKAVAMIIGGTSFGFIIAVLLRSQVGAIAAFLILPTTVEGLLGILLKDNVRYLPFTALGNIPIHHPAVPVATSLMVVTAYVVGFGLLAYVLFLRRDAN